jgi:predicted transglutaminase-like cysteine proteinase
MLVADDAAGRPPSSEPADFMATAGPVGGSPRPWLEFCGRDPARTRCRAAPARIPLTAATYADLARVQVTVNRYVTQAPELTDMGDDWHLLAAGDDGDCEDIALTKRDILLAAGWPAGALRPAICYAQGQVPGGPALHAVLTVETDAGTYVLGNLSPAVDHWTRSECAGWVMRAGAEGWDWIAGGTSAPIRPIP